jgi:AcrR family transcriptional regulator
MATRDTQLRIARAAIELFNEQGTAAVSTNRIAEHCGISTGNLHYHFRTKREIIQFIFGMMVDEMNSDWYRDYLKPTIAHMAEMFTRRAILIYEYRFFYREQAELLRADELLMQRYRDNRVKRSLAIERFFFELDRAGALKLNGDRDLIRSLVHSTRIICDNWLNSIEFMGQTLTPDSIAAGYELILDVLRPYFATPESSVKSESRAGIRHRCEHHHSMYAA